jgi:hypothetical protein
MQLGIDIYVISIRSTRGFGRYAMGECDYSSGTSFQPYSPGAFNSVLWICVTVRYRKIPRSWLSEIKQYRYCKNYRYRERNPWIHDMSWCSRNEMEGWWKTGTWKAWYCVMQCDVKEINRMPACMSFTTSQDWRRWKNIPQLLLQLTRYSKPQRRSCYKIRKPQEGSIQGKIR